MSEEENTPEDFPQELMPSPEQMKEADKTVGILVLTRGEKMDGSKFYAYLSIPPSKYQDFVKAEKKGNYRLEDYGEVLKMGDTLDPSPEIQKEMEEKYGANHNFEEEVIEKVKEIQEEQKSEKRVFDKFGIKKKKKN